MPVAAPGKGAMPVGKLCVSAVSVGWYVRSTRPYTCVVGDGAKRATGPPRTALALSAKATRLWSEPAAFAAASVDLTSANSDGHGVVDGGASGSMSVP